jgi:folate-binding protein YgfZ
MRPLPLHAFHASRGAAFGERGGAEVVRSYGDPASEWAHLSRVAVSDRSLRGFLACVGPDARSYLHGMVTNEVKALRPGQGTYAAVITARGKMLGDARLLVVEDDQVLMDLEPGARDATLAHLAQYLVSEDCEVSDATGSCAILGAYGPAAGELVARVTGEPVPELPLHGSVRRVLGGITGLVVASAPEGVSGFELLVAPEAAEAVLSAMAAVAAELGGGLAGEDALEAARIERGVPRFGADMDESTIPLEANLERAISYTKGCYIGQEVIAKATYRGHVRRRLARLSVPPGTRAGAQLVEGEKSMGLLTSVLDPNPAGGPPLAIGYVRAAQLHEGASLAIEGGGTATVIWAPPPRSPSE